MTGSRFRSWSTTAWWDPPGRTVGGGRVAQVFIGETQGIYREKLTVEDVRDNFATINDRTGYALPQNLSDETALYISHFKG